MPRRYRSKPKTPFAYRLIRSLRQRLRLLDRSGPTFFILGATGNVYTVTLSSTPSCTCPDPTTPCKHIYFVQVRVLLVPLEDSVLRRRTFFPCQLQRLLSEPTSTEWSAGETVRQKFRELFFDGWYVGSGAVMAEEGALCAICNEEMKEEEKLVACGTCRKAVHEECFVRRRSLGGTKCVVCRARWKDRAEKDEYLNLSEYLSEEDEDEDDDSDDDDDSDEDYRFLHNHDVDD